MRQTPTVCGHIGCDHTRCLRVPNAKKKRINTKDNFELRYLRWDYFVKTSNPKDEKIFDKNKATIDNYSRKFMNKHEELISLNSLDIDDLKNIIRCYIVSFDGLWSFTAKPDKLEEFKQKCLKECGYLPTQEMIDKKNNSNMMSFIDQKLQDMMNVFRIKNRNQVGFYSNDFYKIRCDADPAKMNLSSYDENPIKCGWIKITPKEYLALKGVLLQVKNNQSYKIGLWVYKSFLCGGRVLQIGNKGELESGEHDDGHSWNGSLNGNPLDYYASNQDDPLVIMERKEKEREMSFSDDFDQRNNEEKELLLNKAIRLARRKNLETESIDMLRSLKRKYEHK